MLLDYTLIRRAAESTLAAQYFDTKIQFENIQLAEKVDEFIALRDQAGESQPISLDNQTGMLVGTLFVDIYTPIGSGTERARKIANSVANILSGKDIDGISFGPASLYTLGVLENTKWYVHSLHVPYEYAGGAC
jgi:hypothetical protein